VRAFYLVERVAEGDKPDYSPDAALFREFADIPLSREGVLKFANKYGWLGASDLIIPRGVAPIMYTIPQEALQANLNSGCLGERADTWFSEIVAMNRLLRIFDSARGANSAKKRFDQRIRWTADQILYEWQTDESKGIDVIAAKLERPDLFALLQNRNLQETLRWHLEISVDNRLADHKVKVRLQRDASSKQVGLRVVPQTFIGFLWLQFAKAIDGGRSYRRCEDCGKWFELGGQSSRSDKRFCSGTCKARRHRKPAST
jgi:hypothetical protein